MSANAGMVDMLRRVMENGEVSAPRGKPVMELIGQQTRADMSYPLVTLAERRLGYRFAPAEAAWILSGDNRVATIERYSKFIWEFSDDRVFYRGAYGPKVVDQLTHVVESIVADPDTRQAVINIWRENPAPSRDVPCTLSYQFLVRWDLLCVVQTMRSSDVWLGYPYDVFNASMLAGYVALLLRRRGMRVRMGTHTMNVGSSHVYEKDWPAARKLLEGVDEPVFEYEAFDPLSMFSEPQDLIDHLWMLAEQNFQWKSDDGRFASRWLVDGLQEVAKRKTGESA